MNDTKDSIRERATAILDTIAVVNPYNRHAANQINEYWIFQAGFSAAFLASLMEEDPFIARRFRQHVEEVRHGARKKGRR